VPAARNLTQGTTLAADVEVAASFMSRFRGLMGRPSLAPGSGLWITGTSSIHMFFMRFPIDALFLGRPGPDGTRTVVAARPGLRPWTGVVWWAHGADVCLELPVGAMASARTAVGDRVRLSGEGGRTPDAG
jgi:uncharacterized protein